MHNFIRKKIITFIDFFYPIFDFFFSKQIYRYAVCGSFTTLLDITCFYLFYNFIYQKQFITIMIWVIAPHTASFLSSFLVSFPIGFYLNRYIVFQNVEKRKREQILKYLLVIIFNLFINFVFLKIGIEYFNMNANISKICITIGLVIFSFFAQRKFTFK